MAYPTEGNTDPLAYDDRMTFAFHLGVLQALSATGVKEQDGLVLDYPDDVSFKFFISSVGQVLTPLARERIAEHAVENKMDYLLMIDDDMICPRDLFERLYKHNVDIVAPLAFTRYPPHKPVIFRLDRGYDHFVHKEYFVNYPVYDYARDSLFECDAVGFGAVLIKCTVFKGLEKPWFMSTTGAGEDIFFCHKAGKAGFKIFADTATKLTHLGLPLAVSEATFDSEENQQTLRVHGG